MKNKYFIIVCLAFILVTYNHCDMPGMANTQKSTLKFGHAEAPVGSNKSGGNSQNVEYFARTIWPVTNTNCFSCHGTSQQPLHASSNKTTAYNATMDAKKINTSDEEKSRLYLKIKDERHNCWSNCDDDAAEMLAAIQEYSKLIQSNTSGNNTDKYKNHTSEIGPLTEIAGESDQLYFGAESFLLQDPFVLKNENAMDYFTSATNTGQTFANNNVNAGRAFLNFTSTKSAVYNIWAYVKAPSNGDNSFHVKLNNSKYYNWQIANTSGFEWRKVTENNNMANVDFDLTANAQNTLEVRENEDGVSIAKILFTEDLNYMPSSGQTIFYEMKYDISEHLNLPSNSVIFLVDIRDFDEYTYQVTNLRIQTNTKLQLVSPRVIVNNDYNSQHNTYDYIDTIVDIGETQIANYAMLILKDDGNGQDMFSWSFEKLEKK